MVQPHFLIINLAGLLQSQPMTHSVCVDWYKMFLKLVNKISVVFSNFNSKGKVPLLPPYCDNHEPYLEHSSPSNSVINAQLYYISYCVLSVIPRPTSYFRTVYWDSFPVKFRSLGLRVTLFKMTHKKESGSRNNHPSCPGQATMLCKIQKKKI